MRGKEKFFNDVYISKPSENQSKFCEEDLTELDLYNSLKSMERVKISRQKWMNKRIL